MKISLAPLQGYTEYPFRNSLAQHIGGIDKFYTPFLRYENNGTIRSKYMNDIEPLNNAGQRLVPQILVNNAADFKKMALLISERGYTELNWNLGCPYPMVANRKLGSGLLAYPETINQVLTEVVPWCDIDISVKLRAGYQSTDEIFEAVNVLNKYPLKEVIFHPRIGKQLYKGLADFTLFKKVCEHSINSMAYNGDVDSIDKFNEILNTAPAVKHIMIGRGLLKNPFLAKEIKGETLQAAEKRVLFYHFHQSLLHLFAESLSGNSHILNKLAHYWEYFSSLFVLKKKVYKAVKKCKSLNELTQITSEIIYNFELV